MKKYNVTVNGTTYEVLVEEAGAASAPVSAPAQSAAPQAAAPAPAPAQAPAAAPAAGGAIKVTAPMPGTILKMNVKVGDKIEPNGLVLILEAIKMEI